MREDATVKGLRGTIWKPTKYEKITRFTLSVSKKDKKTDKWVSGYIGCLVMNDVVSRELEEKMRVEIDANFTLNEWQDKEGKTHHDLQLWCEDIRFTDNKENNKSNDVMEQFTQPKESEDDELPFV